MDKLKKLEEEIKILEKEKEELRVEIERLKKTRIEEEIIIKRERYTDFDPCYCNGTPCYGAGTSTTYKYYC